MLTSCGLYNNMCIRLGMLEPVQACVDPGSEVSAIINLFCIQSSFKYLAFC